MSLSSEESVSSSGKWSNSSRDTFLKKIRLEDEYRRSRPPDKCSESRRERSRSRYIRRSKKKVPTKRMASILLIILDERHILVGNTQPRPDEEGNIQWVRRTKETMSVIHEMHHVPFERARKTKFSIRIHKEDGERNSRDPSHPNHPSDVSVKQTINIYSYEPPLGRKWWCGRCLFWGLPEVCAMRAEICQIAGWFRNISRQVFVVDISAW